MLFGATRFSWRHSDSISFKNIHVLTKVWSPDVFRVLSAEILREPLKYTFGYAIAKICNDWFTNTFFQNGPVV